jgi:nicotinamidase-related amidase
MKAKETAVVLIEFQNEFCKAGGKLYDGVKGEINRQGTIPMPSSWRKPPAGKGRWLFMHHSSSTRNTVINTR